MSSPGKPTPTDDLPARLSRPARSALLAAGYTRLEQLTQVSARDLLKLHGVGPASLPILRAALAERGWSLAEEGGA
jgi:hypothetical protein